MQAAEIEIWVLLVAILLVRVPRRHEQRFVDLETPGPTLDRSGGRQFGEVPVHGRGHFFLVVWDRLVDFGELQADFRVDVPAQAAAEEAGAEVVVAVAGVAEHHCEVFRDVVEENVQRVHRFDLGRGFEKIIVEDVTAGG